MACLNTEYKSNYVFFLDEKNQKSPANKLYYFQKARSRNDGVGRRGIKLLKTLYQEKVRKEKRGQYFVNFCHPEIYSGSKNRDAESSLC